MDEPDDTSEPDDDAGLANRVRDLEKSMARTDAIARGRTFIQLSPDDEDLLRSLDHRGRGRWLTRWLKDHAR